MKLNKNILLLAVCTLIISSANAGNSAGDTRFLHKDYLGAIEKYKRTIEKAGESERSKNKVAYAKFKIGECNSYLNQPQEAVTFISEAILSGYDKAEAYLVYGKNLQKMGEYKRAKAAFEEYGRLNPSDKSVKNLKASCDFAIRHAAKNPISPEESLNGINTAGMEYGIGYYQSGIIYASTSNTKNGILSKMYYADHNDNFSTSKPVDNMVKSRRGQNTGTFTVDTINNILYYTRCLSNENNDCFIYHSIYKKGKWKNKGILNIGDRHTDAAHPALSPDGNRLYFTSNIAGGYGGSDIWYVEKKANGKWSKKPINAGAVVNTTGNEAFPYVEGNTLIFTSDGHVGFGGYDLYSAQINGFSIAGVQNLMKPVNSSFDDINLIVSEPNDEAFLVSSRHPETNDDIYRFEGIFTSMMVSGHVFNKNTQEPIENAQVIINGMSKSQTVQTNNEGYYYAFIEAGDFYKLLASSIGYISDMSMIKTEKSAIGTFPVEQDFYLSQSAMSISGRVYDLETNEPFINEDVFLLEGSEVIQQTKTDITGRYLFTDLVNGKEYQVKVNKPNFLTISSKPFIYHEGDGENSGFDLASISYNKGNDDPMNRNGRNSNDDGSVSYGREISLHEIYYNFDSANLSPESKDALHRIVLLLNSNPTLKLEFGSHTDMRGTDEYNEKLSVDRAKSVVDYLVGAGINRTRLTWKGYGKRYPVVENAITEEEHRLNRRTTFKIVEK